MSTNENIDTADLTPEEITALTAEGDASAPISDDSGTEEAELRHDPAPIFSASAPQNADGILNQIADIEAQLETRFDDGDITAAEYRRGLSEISQRRSKVEWETRKADLAADMQKQAADNAWYGAVNDFMSTEAKQISSNKALMIAFDQHVKQVTADPANAQLSDRAQLRKAHKLFKAGMESAGVSFDETYATVDALGAMGGGTYAALDRLVDRDPDAYEREFARMSDEQQAEYLAAR